jgi:hypothetical protein
MRLGLEGAWISLGLVLPFKAIHNRPRNKLQKFMKNDILMPHGLDPFSRPVDSNTSGVE